MLHFLISSELKNKILQALAKLAEDEIKHLLVEVGSAMPVNVTQSPIEPPAPITGA